MLRQKIYEDLKSAMKARDVVRLETLRFIWSGIKNAEIDAKHELEDEEVVKLLRTEVKRRQEAIEQFKQGGRNDLSEDEEVKLEVINSYLPQLMSREEIEKVVDEIVLRGTSEFGAVMGQAMGQLKGKADGKLVSEVVRDKLN
jgi:hypothetical protein